MKSKAFAWTAFRRFALLTGLFIPLAASAVGGLYDLSKR